MSEIPARLLAVLDQAFSHRQRRPVIEFDDEFDDLGVDDLERQEIALAIEDEFNCHLNDVDVIEWSSVKDIVELWNRLETVE